MCDNMQAYRIAKTPDDLPPSIDVLVVGGGMAGLTVARACQRLGHGNVVVLEAGPARDVRHVRSLPAASMGDRLWLEPDRDAHFFRPWHATTEAFSGLAGLRQRLGGRSLYWHGVALPIERWALDDLRWPIKVTEDLSRRWAGGPGLYARTLADLSTWCGRNLHLDTPAGLFPMGGLVFSQCPQAIRPAGDGWEAYSPLSDWSHVDRSTTNAVVILPEAPVVGIQLNSAVVASATVSHSSGTQTIRADRIVLAAGTIETTRLTIHTLLDSGLMTERRRGGLVDKTATGFRVKLRRDAVPSEISETLHYGACFLVAPLPRLQSNIFLACHSIDHYGVLVDVWVIGEQPTESAATVHCPDVNHVGGSRRACVEPGDEAAHRRLLHAQQEALTDLWTWLTANVRPLIPPPSFTQSPTPGYASLLGLHTSRIPANQPLPYTLPIGAEQHEAGTLPLGSVTDENGGVPGVAGLYVTGCAVIPRTGAANPAVTVLALATRLAGHLD